VADVGRASLIVFNRCRLRSCKGYEFHAMELTVYVTVFLLFLINVQFRLYFWRLEIVHQYITFLEFFLSFAVVM